MRWSRGYIGKFWPYTYKNFDYARQPITDEEVTHWQNEGYDYVKSFTGSMYNNKNPMPEWVERFKTIFAHYQNLTFTFYKMSTLEIMPTHVDHYRTYMKLFNVNYNNVVRILVMLENWKPGHYLEIDGVGITNWVAGDYFIWESDCPHAAANIGVEDRYTLQITATKIPTENIWKNLHWYNIPNLQTKNESTHAFFNQKILPVINKTTPFYVYLYNENIKELGDIIHDSETINYLNKNGLDFYLYEPLSSYLYGRSPKHNMFFYSEFSHNKNPNLFRSDELDSILSYINRNSLNNVTVHTCEYDVEKAYPYYKSKMNLITDDLFLKTIPPFQNHNIDFSSNFTKKFMCLNWRYAFHRHYIAAYVSRLSSHVSWYYKSDIENIHYTAWTNVFHWESTHNSIFQKFLQGLLILNQKVPMNIDLEVTSAVNIASPNNRLMNPADKTINEIKKPTGITSIEYFYRDIFCDIVNETRFAQPTANYSEKTYQPMFYKRPFLLVAPPYTLKYLKEQGFKTFSDFWDESYDSTENHEKRLFKIFEVIDYIDAKSIEELQIIYNSMIPILEHNYNLVKEKFL